MVSSSIDKYETIAEWLTLVNDEVVSPLPSLQMRFPAWIRWRFSDISSDNKIIFQEQSFNSISVTDGTLLFLGSLLLVRLGAFNVTGEDGRAEVERLGLLDEKLVDRGDLGGDGDVALGGVDLRVQTIFGDEIDEEPLRLLVRLLEHRGNLTNLQRAKEAVSKLGLESRRAAGEAGIVKGLILE